MQLSKYICLAVFAFTSGAVTSSPDVISTTAKEQELRKKANSNSELQRLLNPENSGPGYSKSEFYKQVADQKKALDLGSNVQGQEFVEAQAKAKALAEKHGWLNGIETTVQEGLAGDEREFVEQIKSKLEVQTSQMKSNGWLEGFAKNEVNTQQQKYKNAAQLVSNNTSKRMTSSLQKYAGLNEMQANQFSVAPSVGLKKAIFISFSMTEGELVASFNAAAKSGAEIYVKGLGRGHKNIMDTMRQLQTIAKKVDVKPYARFHPKAFESFDIQQVPTIMVFENKKVSIVHGLLNMEWLLDKHNERDSDAFESYGRLGPTKNVLERSIMEEIQNRVANLDGEKLKKKAVDNFWKNLKYTSLPKASDDRQWFIDPTIRVTADVTNPRGDYLARAGQVINPLAANSFSIPTTIYVINPTDIKQLEWLSKQEIPDGHQPMFLFSELSRDKANKHLAALRAQFKTEFYQLPPEMVKKFYLTGLPARIKTDQGKKGFVINQFYLGEL